jgi:DASS family divalent anion:Na+ symporter
MTKVTRGLLAAASGLAIFFLPVPDGVTQQAWNLLAVFVATIIGFILQPLSIGGVAFTSIAFAMTAKVLTPAQALLPT